MFTFSRSDISRLLASCRSVLGQISAIVPPEIAAKREVSKAQKSPTKSITSEKPKEADAPLTSQQINGDQPKSLPVSNSVTLSPARPTSRPDTGNSLKPVVTRSASLNSMTRNAQEIILTSKLPPRLRSFDSRPSSVKSTQSSEQQAAAASSRAESRRQRSFSASSFTSSAEAPARLVSTPGSSRIPGSTANIPRSASNKPLPRPQSGKLSPLNTSNSAVSQAKQFLRETSNISVRSQPSPSTPSTHLLPSVLPDTGRALLTAIGASSEPADLQSFPANYDCSDDYSAIIRGEQRHQRVLARRAEKLAVLSISDEEADETDRSSKVVDSGDPS